MPVSILIYYLAIASSMRPPDDILMDNAPFTTPSKIKNIAILLANAISVVVICIVERNLYICIYIRCIIHHIGFMHVINAYIDIQAIKYVFALIINIIRIFLHIRYVSFEEQTICV